MSPSSNPVFSSVDEPVAPTGQISPPKVFAQPFRLAFKRLPDDKSMDVSNVSPTWIEVRSLEGLRKVVTMLREGELVEVDRFASLEMQLWGLLAEHTGFLRTRGNTSTLNAGIQPLGEGLAAVAEDIALLFGGDEALALRNLNAMRNVLKKRPCADEPMVQPPVTNEFVKPDGVNLTEQGEDALQVLVFGDPSKGQPTSEEHIAETLAFRKESENAIEIFNYHTPRATSEEIEAEAKEAVDCEIAKETGNTEGPVVTGPEAALQGRLVEKVGRGLEAEDAKEALTKEMGEIGLNITFNTPEKPVPQRSEGLRGHDAISEIRDKIREIFPDLRNTPDHELTAERIALSIDRIANLVPGLEQFDISMKEIKDLAEAADPRNLIPRRRQELAERAARTEVVDGVMMDEIKRLAGITDKPVKRPSEPLTEVELSALVDASEIEELGPEALAQHQTLADYVHREAERTDRTFYPEGESPYAERDVTSVESKSAEEQWNDEVKRLGPHGMDAPKDEDPKDKSSEK
jgi:hypothetical protein